MKYLFIAKGDDDPATRYRVLPLLDRLRAKGLQTELVSSDAGTVGKIRLLRKAAEADVVFVQRKLFSSFFAARLRRASKRLIFDFDDAVFLRSSGEQSAARRARFENICAGADLVFAGNRYLADEAGNLNSAVIHVPTPVDARPYQINADKDGRFTMVWIGSRSTRRYLESHRELLEFAGREIPGIRLKVIADFDFSLEGLEVINVPWSSKTEPSALMSSHVGIAPMEDNPWTRGKCALKVIQYMASRLPVISSPVGANRDVVVDGETGILAGSANEWVKALKYLLEGDTARRMGHAGYERFVQKYSVDAVVRSMLVALGDRSWLTPAV